jgi:hypothetical protein
MPTQYPSSLPQPLVSGFGAVVASGVIRDGSDVHQEQRRVFDAMPHSFSLSFIMSLAEWDAWARWIADNGHRWFEIELPTMYAGKADQFKAPVLIRLTSNVPAATVSGEHVQVSVSAEMAPSMIDQYLTGEA